jgi:hypothetical protein
MKVESGSVRDRGAIEPLSETLAVGNGGRLALTGAFRIEFVCVKTTAGCAGPSLSAADRPLAFQESGLLTAVAMSEQCP